MQSSGMKRFEPKQRVTTMDHVFEGEHAIPMGTIGTVISVESRGVRIRFSSEPDEDILVHEGNLDLISTKPVTSDSNNWSEFAGMAPKREQADPGENPSNDTPATPGFPALGRRSHQG